MKKIIIVFVAVLSMSLALCACSKNKKTTDEQPINEQPTNEQSAGGNDDKKMDFVGVTFKDATYTYDGNSYILSEVSGAPENTTITYVGRNEYVDAGTYSATAELVKEGYNDKTLTATLKIEPANMTGITYESKAVAYDGANHANDIQLVGVLPAGTTTKETIKNSSGNVVTVAIDVGTYEYTCVISNKNYVTETVTATLAIKAQNKDLPVFVSSDGTVYFANGLHNDYLYSLNSESELKLIDYSSPKEFNKYNNSTALFIAGSVFLNSVKQVNGGSTSILYTDDNIDDFVKHSETIYYYSSNSLKSSNSGIYKVDATDSGSEPKITKVFEGKSDNLAISGNYLYFTNGNNNNYLYRMNLSNSAVSLVAEEKVHEYIINGNKLYCVVNGLINDYIGCVDLSDLKLTKLTDASGKFLTVKNGYLYYNYTDLYSIIDSNKKGIWRISTSGGEPEQVLKSENISGFDVESSSVLVYIDSVDLHLYRYNTSTKTKTDLLNGFVAPESTPLNLGGQTVSSGNKTYYLNMYAGKTLYVYDETTKKCSQLTPNKVESFCIYNDIMYFNQVTMITNNDLYAINLKGNSEAEKVNNNDVREMVVDGTYMYAVHYNWAGVAAGLSRMKLDGSEYVKFSDVNGAKNLTVKDGKLYYINCATGQDNGNVEYINLGDITSTSEKLTGTNLSKNIKNVKQFVFDGNNIFYIYNGMIENSVRRTDLTTLGEGTKIASSKTNPNEIILSGNYVYYYSYAATATSSAGLYRVSKTAAADGTQELILGYDSLYYCSNLSISDNGYLYFLNYIPKLLFGNAHFYQVSLNGNSVVKIS